MAEIVVTIEHDGTVKVSVAGVKGRSCVELTNELVKALGEEKSVSYTGEFYQAQIQQSARVRKQ